nr:hypothetical protein [Paracoccus saliphilus]
MSLIARISSLSHRDRITSVGLALTGIWLFLVALFWLLGPGGDGGSGGVSRLVATAGVVMPVALIWLAVSLARAIAVLRAEADDLRHRLSDLRRAVQTGEAPEADPEADIRPATPKAAVTTVRAEPAPAHPPAPLRMAAPKVRSAADQRPPAPQPEPGNVSSVDNETLIRALNFPNGPDDQEAIEALREALRDPANSRVLRAAQDVVTLMAGRDLYMDDLPPDPVRPDVWRRYAAGERGSAVAPLGGVHDDTAMDIVAAMLREDEIFRDTVHHFLRHFDGLIGRVVPQLDDLQIAVLADSRSARAFMLLGRVSGVFG